VLEFHRAGTVTGPDPLVGGPELPTAVEPVSGMVSLNSGGLFAPARTVKEIVDRIDRATRNAMSAPKW
jgi:tripartite-type tricarboxylate transporter receptor subunit TctC